ncbi:MAG: PDZ domain-containing protein [Chloroflexi bacterium AL-W]|nr:PDZ domain-containing protein [Chloroflexi bacterium AL-N1]NOK71239.1 PDZ domain-containing protein [Chloroflexi bacterium AL-N10]NOK76528.1 PDZ domain-containing protein [Chloroflexi bacterium AL-N5]NOK83646.1 PDZ domain-containing protein [Chloroflexi bacterium AL-W]NOK92233.1 PDZ domain-containing protein [Chloroflexi bacterium AL-N15]
MDATNDLSVLSAMSTQMADAVERVGQSLVMVNGRQRQSASGVVYAPNTILTADHVLEREEDLTIETPDQRKLPARFAGRDSATDLAILDVPDLGLDPATTTDVARVGQFVLAVGRPTSDGPMASLGIVSAVGGPVRTQRGAMLEQYIRTDATPYPGFSGGPLTSTDGTVLGIVTTGLVGGVALAVPSPIAWRIAETLTQHGTVKRGFLGLSCQPVPLPDQYRQGREQERGLLVVRVEDDSPAEKGGLLLGDVIITLDGNNLSDTDDLQALLTGNRVGQAVPVEVVRGGTPQTLQVTIGQRK